MADYPGPGWLTLRPDGVRCSVKVTPRASKSGVRGIEQDARGGACLALRVAAPPDGGKANAEAVRMLAKRWGLAPSDLRLVSGATSRRKVIELTGPPEQLAARLRAIEERGEASTGDG